MNVLKLRINYKKIIGYLLIYFMLIWNQSNLKEIFLKDYSYIPLLICSFLLFFKSKRLSIWCGICSIFLIISAILVRLNVGGIGINAIISLLSSIYIVSLTIAYNKDQFFNRFIITITFLASVSLIFWFFCLLVPSAFENLVPTYNSLMTYRVYTDAINYQEFNYTIRGLFIYTMRSVDTRNVGVFTEPGVYQMVLNTGIFIILFMDKFTSLNNKRICLVILIATLCTTQSTTGFIGLTLIFLFYLLSSTYSSENEVLRKRNILIYLCVGLILLFVDYQFRGGDSILQTTIIDKLFPNGNVSLIENSSSVARVGTIIISIISMIKNPFGIGYTNFYSILNSEETGYVAAEILRFGAVWGVIPLFVVLWWIFWPLKKGLSLKYQILYILLYINTLLAQSNIFYTTLIMIPLGIVYMKPSSEIIKLNQEGNQKEGV